MNKISLKKNGSIAHNGKIAEDDPLMYLSFGITLEDGYTLRSFFQLFEHYEILSRLNAFFATFREQYEESPSEHCLYDGFDYLEFAKIVEMVGFPGEPRLDIYHSLRGILKDETFELKAIALDCLLDMPLKTGALKHIVFGDSVDVFTFETAYTLFEFIDGVLWDLSFQGTLMACELRR
ncbi:hypothetical protein QUF90_02285 [Desulfococcaceae bacterium HSG9]|nr:hypothetical protein [Desulfococcaceae bacterium HSG9]